MPEQFKPLPGWRQPPPTTANARPRASTWWVRKWLRPPYVWVAAGVLATLTAVVSMAVYASSGFTAPELVSVVTDRARLCKWNTDDLGLNFEHAHPIPNDEIVLENGEHPGSSEYFLDVPIENWMAAPGDPTHILFDLYHNDGDNWTVHGADGTDELIPARCRGDLQDVKRASQPRRAGDAAGVLRRDDRSGWRSVRRAPSAPRRGPSNL